MEVGVKVRFMGFVFVVVVWIDLVLEFQKTR